MGHLDSGILLSAKKKKSYQTMKRQGEILNAYYQVKEANRKRLHTV